MKRRKVNLKNIILNTITGLAVALLFVAIAFLDLFPLTSAVVILATLGWILLYSLANQEYYEVEEDARDEK